MILELLVLLLPTQLTGDPPAATFDPSAVTVSGISAGGYLAHQLHLAYPDRVRGVGIVAGGPYGCAEGSLGVAMARCMGNATEPIDVGRVLERIEAAVAEERIPPASSIADDRVWLFRGTRDATVPAVVTDALAALYRRLSAEVIYVDDVAAAHHFPALAAGHACDESVAPFIGACDFDGAGELLKHLYDDLSAPADPAAQIETIEVTAPAGAHLLPEAYLYRPPACREGSDECRLHLVLHGCAQSAATLGDRFVREAGYLRWADPNRLILLFPQVQPSAGNPYACWDWWGYSSAGYLDRGAPQMQALIDLIDTLEAR